MSLKDYDYPVVNKESICNNCNKYILCHQCNECFAMTCNLCILYHFKSPRFPKCNNCNNLFICGELDISKTLYDNVTYSVDRDILKYHAKIRKPNENLRMKELDDVCKELKDKLFILMRELSYDMKKDNSLCKLFILSKKLYANIKNNNVCFYSEYLTSNERYPLISKINNLYFKYHIYKKYLIICIESIYYEINIEKLKMNLADYITDDEFDYTKSLDDKYADYGEFVYCIIFETTNSIKLCTVDNCEIDCYANIKKYLNNKKDLSYCNKCRHYNIKFKNYSQIYCIVCKNIYDCITLKSESFITNPLCIVNKYCNNDRIMQLRFKKYLDKLPKNIIKFIKDNKKKLDPNLKIYSLFSEIIKKYQF